MKNKLAAFIKKPNHQLLIILGVTFICYFNSVFNDYSFDDETITENIYIPKGINGWKDIWTHSYLVLDGINIDYRPLTLTFFSLEFMLFGKQAPFSHAISLLLYMLCLLLLFRVSKSVFRLDRVDTLIPFVIVLLFAIHPSHIEVVSSIKNKDEILSFIFILLAALFYQRSYSGSKPYQDIPLCLLFFYLSMLSKQVSVPFMACLFLWSLYEKQYKHYKVFSILLAGSLCIIIAHLYYFRDLLFHRGYSFYEDPIVAGTSLGERLGLGFNILLFYLKFLFIPFPFRFYYGYNVIPFESIVNPMPLLSLLLYVSLIGLLLFSILKKKSYSFYLFSFLFCVLFYSNVFTKYAGIVSERAMFQFSYFFISFFVLFLYFLIPEKKNNKQKQEGQGRRYLRILFLFYLLFFSILTIRRNFDWKDSQTLALHDIQYLKKSTLSNQLTGNICYVKCLKAAPEDTLSSRKWAQLAIYYFNESLAVSPERKKVYYFIGNVYKYGLNDPDLAEKNYLAATKSVPLVKGLSRELASLYFVKGEYQKAIPYYTQAVLEEPEVPELIFYRVLNLYNAKKTDDFLRLNDSLNKKYPYTQYPYLNYGTYYYNLNQPEKVVENFEKAIQYGCSNPKIFDFIIRYYSDRNETEKADYYRTILKKYSAVTP